MDLLVDDMTWVEPFLAFGFAPSVSTEDPLALLAEWSRMPVWRVDDVSLPALVRDGVAAIGASMRDCAATTAGGQQQVVFLSGGLDSRAILGGLLQVFDSSQVVAATFGRPGEQDFDFATEVARRVGVRHERLESFAVEWTTQGLVESALARQLPLPSVFGQRYLSYLLHRHLGPDNVFWDGLSGDATGGKGAPAEGRSPDWDEAGVDFLDYHLHPQWRSLVTPGYEPTAVLPVEPFCRPEQMGYDEQLGFGLRQQCRTVTRLLRGYPVRTPFLTRPWLDFMLRVPLRYRHNQYLYREILKTAFPRLWTLPTTALDGGALIEPPVRRTARELRFRARRKATKLGLIAGSGGRPQRANQAIQHGYREQGDIRDLLVENLADLSRRGVVGWLDVDAYVRGVEEGGHLDDTVVTRLLNVELNLKAAEQRLRDPQSSRAGGT